MALVAAFALAVMALSACSGPSGGPSNKSAQEQAQDRAKTRTNYVPKNDVEGNNYNARQRIADSPSTLIWCTAFPTNPNAKPVTIPIVGKLTSGNKRPYPNLREFHGGADGTVSGSDYFNPELAGPDGMFGSSGEYRYGFRPDGVYVDFYNLETYCTSAPTVFQKQSTTIDLSSSGNDTNVESALATCRAANPDPSKPCTAAQGLVDNTVTVNK